MKLIISLAGLALAAPATAQGLPEWMTGCWQMQDGDRWAEECWMSPRGGLMLGAGRSGSGDMVGDWESMQIVVNEAEVRRDAAPTMTFWASPNGQPRVGFALASSDADGVTFVNAAHDYPQRVRYWREGDLLRAEISRADGSEAQSWTFEPVGGE